MDDYYALWGINATVLDRIKEADSHLEVWTLNQEGSGFSVHALVGEEVFGEQEWIWNAPTHMLSLGINEMAASASLIGPNTIQILNLAMLDQITEIQTLKFTATGVEVGIIIKKQNTQVNLLLCRKPMWRPKPMKEQARQWHGRALTQELMV